jgi:hypothetical protein
VQVVIEQHRGIVGITSKPTSYSLVPNDKIGAPIKVMNLFLYIIF